MKTKIVHRLHRLAQREWHPQPIIAEGISKCRREKSWNENKILHDSNADIKIKKISVNLGNLWTNKSEGGIK
jgi:hypothetical protein